MDASREHCATGEPTGDDVVITGGVMVRFCFLFCGVVCWWELFVKVHRVHVLVPTCVPYGTYIQNLLPSEFNMRDQPVRIY